MHSLKNKALSFWLLVIIPCLLLFNACKRNPTTWEDDLVAPLATGSLSLSNLFPDTTIKANADSTLKIAFESNLINYQLDSLLKIPDTTTVTLFTLPFSAQITPGMTLLAPPTPSENSYDLPNGIKLRKAIVKQGKLRLKITNSVRQPLVYHYQFISATKNNIMLDETFNIPGSSTIVNYIDIAGYTIDFTGTGNEVNTTLQNYTVSVANNAAPLDTIFPNQGFIDSLTIVDMIPQYALGYFGNQIITVGPDTASFAAFNAIKKGLLNLNSASVSVNINNQFGIAMKADISQITSINTNNPSTVPLTYTNEPLSNFFVSSAINNGLNAPVGASTNTISLNNSNSNVKDFIGNLPGRLSYKLTAQINPPPLNNVSGNNDFGYYGTSFSANLSMDVPLYFSASNLILADTVSLNVSTISQLQNVNKGNIILTATNSYPFSIALNAVLLDENKHYIDNLFSSPSLIEAPPLDANNKVISPLKSKLYVPLNPQKIANVQKARYVAYSATFNTANQPNQIKFYSNYTLDLLMTADINYTIGK